MTKPWKRPDLTPDPRPVGEVVLQTILAACKNDPEKLRKVLASIGDQAGAEAIRLVLAFKRGEQLPSPVASVETARARRKARTPFRPPPLQKELAL